MPTVRRSAAEAAALLPLREKREKDDVFLVLRDGEEREETEKERERKTECREGFLVMSFFPLECSGISAALTFYEMDKRERERDGERRVARKREREREKENGE